MARTLLDLVGDAALEIGLERPTTALNGTNKIGEQLAQHATRTGQQLVERHAWPILRRIHTFPTVASQEDYALPDDFDRLIGGTAYDTSNFDMMRGSLTPQEWQAIKNSFLGSGVVDRRFQIRRGPTQLTNRFYLDPIPSSVVTLSFEYVSKYWVVQSGAANQDRFMLDTDEYLLPDSLMVMGTKWRYQAAKGLATTDFAEFWASVDAQYAQAKAPDTLPLGGPRFGIHLLDHSNVPETGFG